MAGHDAADLSWHEFFLPGGYGDTTTKTSQVINRELIFADQSLILRAFRGNEPFTVF
jgi:hypothetical protein